MPKSIVTSALTDLEISELKAHHLACSHLVRGCQDAIFRFRGSAAGDADAERVAHRTVEILEDIVASWCETVSMLRSALDHASNGGALDMATRGERHALMPGSRSKTTADTSTLFAGSP